MKFEWIWGRDTFMQVVKGKKITGQALQDYYRCPEEFLAFVFAGDLSSEEGYFRFGADVCYGHSSSKIGSSHVPSHLHDALQDSSNGAGTLKLPFDPTEVINNLRLERYINNVNGSRKLLKGMYYLLRPFTTLSLRRRIQKFQSRNWQQRTFPQWPVDTTVENLCEKLLLMSLQSRNVDKIPFVWFWPNGARGCLTMTHDVEAEAGKTFCAQLMDIDESFGIKASFQIVPESRYKVTREFVKSIQDRGFEVVIHDLNHDGRLFDNREEFLQRAQKINAYVKEYNADGFRAAVLYRNPEWINDLNVSYDMSIPNVAHLDPQQGGCCTVTPYFIDGILEIPVTVVQDYMLMHILNQHSIDLWKAQTELIFDKHGLANFIVHPDYIIEPKAKSLYQELLGYLRSHKDVWFALPREINAWWRMRSKMSVVREGSSWRVVGEGSENAQLAFAKNVDGKLVYEFANSSVV